MCWVLGCYDVFSRRDLEEVQILFKFGGAMFPHYNLLAGFPRNSAANAALDLFAWRTARRGQ